MPRRRIHAALLKRSVQAAVFLLFLYLLGMAGSGPESWADPGWLQQCDPLSAVGALFTGRAWLTALLPGLVILALTALLGRLFCGYVCPLGSCVDVAGRLLTPRTRRPFLGRLRRLKEALLVAVAVAAIAGFALYSFFAPLPLLGRALAYTITPGVLALADLGLDAARPLAESLGALELARTTLDAPPVATGPTVLILLLIVLLLVLVAPRLWCRTLCPAGALLGIAAARARFRRVVGAECDGCGACARRCPMGAIPPHQPDRTDRRECTLCRTCATVCPRGAIRYRFSAAGSTAALGPEAKARRTPAPASLSRRSFLALTGGGAACGVATAIPALGGARDSVVRPPGALPEPFFSATCLRCGLCVRACPTHTLRPTGLEDGLAAFWTPRLDTRDAPCDPHCASCGAACPSHAIRALPLEEKTHAKLGTAEVDRERCIAWAQDHFCLVCDEVCPINAIEFRTRPGKNSRVPFVVDDRCNGCGACDTACPVEGPSAIPVRPRGQLRLAEGSYVAEARKRGLVFQARETEDETQGMPEAADRGGGGLPPGFAPAEGDKLPPGFSE